jgi:hypothetical protein
MYDERMRKRYADFKTQDDIIKKFTTVNALEPLCYCRKTSLVIFWQKPGTNPREIITTRYPKPVHKTQSNLGFPDLEQSKNLYRTTML